MSQEQIYILAIESSCDDTAAAVSCNDKILANIVAGQDVHKAFGGVVPELASRAHQQNIVPVVDTALKAANIAKEQLQAIAYTRGPGLMGSLLVGSSFAKGFSLGLNIPLIEVNHTQAHVLANFIALEEKEKPTFPHLCLTVSGGHTQIVLVKNFMDMEVVGSTNDDAAGEAFDKAAKILGLPYPGGPLVDKKAEKGDSSKFSFPFPNAPDFDYSFSGLKTSLLYLIKAQQKVSPDFIAENMEDLCASFQQTIVQYLLLKFEKAMDVYQVKSIGLAGGVSANSELRKQFTLLGEKKSLPTFIPAFEYCTDNAAMIAITGYYKFLAKAWANTSDPVLARYKII
jgi:N6-L-threonylcarbamoyladenine synthase